MYRLAKYKYYLYKLWNIMNNKEGNNKKSGARPTSSRPSSNKPKPAMQGHKGQKKYTKVAEVVSDKVEKKTGT
jgi:23S rRNA pseudouridine2605 synthase